MTLGKSWSDEKKMFKVYQNFKKYFSDSNKTFRFKQTSFIIFYFLNYLIN